MMNAYWILTLFTFSFVLISPCPVSCSRHFHNNWVIELVFILFLLQMLDALNLICWFCLVMHLWIVSILYFRICWTRNLQKMEKTENWVLLINYFWEKTCENDYGSILICLSPSEKRILIWDERTINSPMTWRTSDND